MFKFHTTTQKKTLRRNVIYYIYQNKLSFHVGSDFSFSKLSQRVNVIEKMKIFFEKIKLVKY